MAAKADAPKYFEEIEVTLIFLTFLLLIVARTGWERSVIFRVLRETHVVRAVNKICVVLNHKPCIVILVIRVALNFCLSEIKIAICIINIDRQAYELEPIKLNNKVGWDNT